MSRNYQSHLAESLQIITQYCNETERFRGVRAALVQRLRELHVLTSESVFDQHKARIRQAMKAALPTEEQEILDSGGQSEHRDRIMNRMRVALCRLKALLLPQGLVAATSTTSDTESHTSMFIAASSSGMAKDRPAGLDVDGQREPKYLARACRKRMAGEQGVVTHLRETRKLGNDVDRDIELYVTPEWVTEKFIEAVLVQLLPQGSTVWEPCCGTMAMVKPLQRYYHVVATDLHTVPHSHDFLNWKPPQHIDAIVTNPPYSQKVEFIKRAQELSVLWFFLLPFDVFMPAAKAGVLCGSTGTTMWIEPDPVKFVCADAKVQTSRCNIWLAGNLQHIRVKPSARRWSDDTFTVLPSLPGVR